MSPRVLLLGGHGKVAQLLIPSILSRSWQLTSVIRDAAQRPTITALGKSQPGTLDVLVSSLEEVNTQSQAQSIINSTSPTHIVWSAGSGGKGGPERTKAIDQDACIAFIRAAVATPSVFKFILISYIGSRVSQAPWWSDAEWTATNETNNGVLKSYHHAKMAADECLTTLYSKLPSGRVGISLRPGSLTDEVGQGQVTLGKTEAVGSVRRGDVARVVVELLANEGVGSCWLDLLQGKQDVEAAVRKCVKESVDCSEGEDVEAMARKWT